MQIHGGLDIYGVGSRNPDPLQAKGKIKLEIERTLRYIFLGDIKKMLLKRII